MDNRRLKYQEFRDLIYELILLFQPRTYCEIGIRKGYVFNYVAPLLRRAVAVDIVPFRGIYKQSNAIHFQMSSEQFAVEWSSQEDTTIDFLFIDADHSRDEVLGDYERLSPFVPEHTGLILLHDTYPINEKLLHPTRCSDAWRAAKHIRSTYQNEVEIITLPGPIAGLSIIRKAKTHGWMDK